MKLKPMRIEDGWFGDRGTWETNYAAVAGYADFKGDKASAAWLPNRYVAYVWRSFVSRDPPVQVVAQTTDGRLKTPPFKPMDKRFLIVPHGTGVELAAEVRPGAEIRKAAFYDGDVRLGEAAVAPFSALLVAGACWSPGRVRQVYDGRWQGRRLESRPDPSRRRVMLAVRFARYDFKSANSHNY